MVLSWRPRDGSNKLLGSTSGTTGRFRKNNTCFQKQPRRPEWFLRCRGRPDWKHDTRFSENTFFFVVCVVGRYINYLNPFGRFFTRKFDQAISSGTGGVEIHGFWTTFSGVKTVPFSNLLKNPAVRFFSIAKNNFLSAKIVHSQNAKGGRFFVKTKHRRDSLRRTTKILWKKSTTPRFLQISRPVFRGGVPKIEKSDVFFIWGGRIRETGPKTIVFLHCV